MVNVILSGAMGAMCREVAQTEGIKVLAGVDFNNQGQEKLRYMVYKNYSDIPQSLINVCDCVIDFSHYTALPQVLNFCLSHHLPLVIGTTGLSDRDIASVKSAAKTIPIVLTSNMSQGINAILKILGPLSKTLVPSFDIEVIEKHHNRKKDAPSGTALLLANAINEEFDMTYDYTYSRVGKNEPRNKKEIGFSSVRGGSYPGEHTIIFAGEDEVIEIKHIALSRRIFALGAARAAEWIENKPAGLYNMLDVLEGDNEPAVETVVQTQENIETDEENSSQN